MKASTVLRSLTVVALAAACTPKAAPPPPPPPAPDASAIRTALTTELAKFSSTFDTKDTAAVANQFTADATWILPDASTYTGHADIAAGAAKLFASFPAGMTYSPATLDKLVVVNDSEAVTFSHSDYTVTGKGKKPASRVNPFADYWKKGADGVWRIAYEINADGPAPAAAKQ
jgi:uncharacterized protein (TIGR02246 family)